LDLTDSAGGESGPATAAYPAPVPAEVRSASPAPRPYAKLGAMPIDPELLEILACPVCKTPVQVVKDGAGLRCATCRRVYPVQDDIPVMLVDEAKIEE
jgi:uncharacterized protein YbaR (Trm112 family)